MKVDEQGRDCFGGQTLSRCSCCQKSLLLLLFLHIVSEIHGLNYGNQLSLTIHPPLTWLITAHGGLRTREKAAAFKIGRFREFPSNLIRLHEFQHLSAVVLGCRPLGLLRPSRFVRVTWMRRQWRTTRTCLACDVDLVGEQAAALRVAHGGEIQSAVDVSSQG